MHNGASGGGPAGHACAARIVGSDAAHDLALLQLECGGAFQPVALGNSRDVMAGDAAVAVSTSASGRSFTLSKEAARAA
jgi:S1-C subfamily serine protease